MVEGQVEVSAEKSPADIARENVAPRGYEWLTNYSVKSSGQWLADLRLHNEDVVDLKTDMPAFDDKGKPESSLKAAYVKRKPQKIA